jgi:hypothetical protein
LVLASLAGHAGGLGAQGVRLELRGQVGPPVRAITGLRGTVVFREINEAGQPIGDSVVGEMTASAGIAYQVVAAAGSSRVVELRYDSLKSRARLLGQAWKEGMPQATGRPIRLTVDSTLAIEPGAAAALPADPVAAGGILSWNGVSLPGRVVAPGDTWTVNVTYRLPGELAQLLEIALPDSVRAVATVSLDSVAARGADTLAYLTVKHPIGPVTLPARDAGDSATVELAGSQAASLVWSTGWNAYVAGAGQARVIGRLRSVNRAGTPRMAELTWSLGVRLTVRL